MVAQLLPQSLKRQRLQKRKSSFQGESFYMKYGNLYNFREA